jgi:hypothetical protein
MNDPEEGQPMLIEWTYEDLATAMPVAPATMEEAHDRLLRALRSGRVRYFVWDSADWGILVHPVEDYDSVPLSALLQRHYEQTTVRGNHPALLIVVFVYEEEVLNPGAHGLRYLHLLWDAAQGRGTFERLGEDGVPATLEEVRAHDLRDCVERLLDPAGAEEPPI